MQTAYLFHFLSVFTNLLMGTILLFLDPQNITTDTETDEPYCPVLRDSAFILIVTIFAGIAAVFKALSPTESKIAILGDLVPMIAGILGCFVFLIRYLETFPDKDISSNHFLRFVKEYERIKGVNVIGLLCLFAAAAHLLFPALLFI